MTQKLSGGCACGAIHYDCNADPVICSTVTVGTANGQVAAPTQQLSSFRKLRCRCVGSRGITKSLAAPAKRWNAAFPDLRQPRDRQIGTAAQRPRIASGKLGRPINVPTHDGRIYLKTRSLGITWTPRSKSTRTRRGEAKFRLVSWCLKYRPTRRSL